MPAVCANCSHVHGGGGPCPRCGTDPAGLGGVAPRWQQTSLGRILIGLVVSQGLFYGLKQLLTGALLAVRGGSVEELWADLNNVAALQALQLVAVLAGGMLAAGGQQGGLTLGILAGAWNGVLAVLLRQVPAEVISPIALYCQPVIHAVTGAMGGLIGVWIWRPVGVAVDPEPAGPIKAARRKPRPLFAGPVAWVRVILGAGVAVGGTLYAGHLLDQLAELSRGRYATTSSLQDTILTWEVRSLALLLGGAFAGALTRNGLKQGLVVGIVASLVLVGVQSAKGNAWLELALFTVAGTFSLTLVGGWFGGQLFPPVVTQPRRASA